MASTILTTIKRWDDAAFLAFNDLRRRHIMSRSFRFATQTGNGLLYLACAPLVWRFSPDRFRFFIVSAGIAFVFSLVAHPLVKKLVRRQRPFETLPTKADFVPIERFSFPSGHTTHAFTMAVVLAVIFPPLSFPVFVWATIIGVSRIYLGVHFPSDVLAGMALGCLCGALGLTLGA